MTEKKIIEDMALLRILERIKEEDHEHDNTDARSNA